MPPRSIHVDSPAKVNLVLDILRKRKDGYHDLRTIFQKISLHDTLRFTLTGKKQISITATHPGLPTGNGNLVYRAASAVLGKSDFAGGVRIHIVKRIPLGAGLGGGSSNAATTLGALNRLLAIGLPKKELMNMGSEIGADVPFFFMKGAAVGTGIGDRLREIKLPRLWYILLYPNFEVSARWAYEHFVLTKVRHRHKIQEVLTTSRKIASALRNDLEAAVSDRHPEIEAMKNVLLSAGSLGALMTGSGPTVFGVFAAERKALEAYRKIKTTVKKEGWVVLKAHSLSS